MLHANGKVILQFDELVEQHERLRHRNLSRGKICRTDFGNMMQGPTVRSNNYRNIASNVNSSISYSYSRQGWDGGRSEGHIVYANSGPPDFLFTRPVTYK